MNRKRAKGPNRSSAVMQQRHEDKDSLDDFSTPPFATRAVCEYIAEKLTSERLGKLTARDPCANRGHMVRPLQEYFSYVDAADVHDYGIGARVEDYLFPFQIPQVDWTFANPPFRLAEQFIDRALASSRKGVVIIQRTSFLEGQDRYRELYAKTRPSHILQFVCRVCMLRGRLVQYGKPDPSEENPKRVATTATSYIALIWVKDRIGKQSLFDWICPDRTELEIDGDYPDEPDGNAKLHKPLMLSE